MQAPERSADATSFFLPGGEDGAAVRVHNPAVNLHDLSSCTELTDEHAALAAHSADAMREFLGWAAEVARPGDGAPKILMAFAHLASAEWFEGSPYVEIRGSETTTTLSVFSSHGVGIRERVVPLARLRVDFDEFVRATTLAPQLVSPLQAIHRGGALVLAFESVEAEATSSSPATPIPIDSGSLVDSARGDGNGEAAGIHTRPTVRRFVAIRPEARRVERDDG